jgi:hypothetical protein
MTLHIGEKEIKLSAETIEDKIEELAEVVRSHEDQTDGSTEDIVRKLTHREYLKNRTVENTLHELSELQLTYADEFNEADGRANKFILSKINDSEPQYWYDYPESFLALGLEWAVLNKLGETVEIDKESKKPDYDNIESWDTEELLQEYESLVSFRTVESEEGQISIGEIRRLKRTRNEVRRRIES